MRSSSATTKELPFCTYFFLTKANLPCTRAESLLHFSKLQEREGGIPLHSHIPHSVSHVPARAQWRLSLLHLAPLSRLSLQLSLSPFLFRFSQTNTDRHEGEEEFDARQRPRLSVSSLGEICARFSHNPHDIRHIRQTQRRTLRAWEWRVLLSSLFLPPHPLPRPFLFRLACLL